MIKFAVTLFIMCAATPSFALNIKARSGEHDGFTRVVFYIPEHSRWTSEHTVDGIELTFHGHSAILNANGFFTRLHKGRIRNIFVDSNSKKIVLQFGCHCRANQFTTKTGLLVYDIKPSLNVKPEQEAGPNALLPLFLNKAPVRMIPFISDFTDKAGPDLNELPEIGASRALLINALSAASAANILEKTEPNNILSPSVGASSQPKPTNLEISDSIDSTHLAIDRNPPLTQEGIRCPPNDELSLFEWAGRMPFHEQIAIARSKLVGEFDKIDPLAVDGLIRLYLALGFGAEARQTVNAFQITQDREKYLAIADILDPEEQTANTFFKEFLSCNTHAALWSILLQDPLPKNPNLNPDAIAFAIMSLPHNLKPRLGALVAERVLQAGYSALSETIVRHIEQTSSTPSLGQDLMFARLQRHAGQSDKAVARLESILRSTTSVTPDALIEFIDLKIYLNQPIDHKFADLAGVLAWEYKDSEIGRHLQHYQIKAFIMGGKYHRALQHYKTAPKAHQFDNEFAQLMTSKASDAAFIKAAFFIHPKELDSALPKIAKRLINLGFWQRAESFLNSVKSKPMINEQKVLMAEIALERKAPEKALALLNGLSDPSALMLQAKALMATGKFGLAEQVFASLNDADKQTVAAWHNQNADGLRDLGKPALADLLELGSQNPSKDMAVLAQNRYLVNNSQQLRSVLGAALLSVQSLAQ
tara:strand:- start:641 stop:2752 length:2112 start_codon:yes stop_codon:yes gene_type:complete